MIREHFQRKLALFFTALVAVVQLLALVAVVAATDQNVRQQVEQDLAVGAKVVSRLLDSRSRQLPQSVRVLTADFGFKQAVATGDRPTIRSALGNHGGRIEADMAVLLDTDGRVRAGTLDALAPGAVFPLERLRRRAIEQGEAVGFGPVGDRPGIAVIVDETLANIAHDSRIVAIFADSDIGRLQEKLVEQLCQLGGGPCEYTGDPMDEVHAELDIDPAEFNAFVEDLRDAAD